MSYYGFPYHLYVSPYTMDSIVIKKTITMHQTNIKEMEPLIKTLLTPIFNMLVAYNFWWLDVYNKNKYLAFGLLSINILTLATLPIIIALIISHD